VIIEATTDTFGRVSEARVIKGHPLLNQAAVEAIRRWIYEPFLINGVPKPVRFTVTITFRLDNT
jgi:TonB family protein